MAADLTFAEISTRLREGEQVDDWFEVLRLIAGHAAFGEAADQRRVRDALIRALERRSELNGYSAMLDSMAVAAGLYPYATSANLGIRAALTPVQPLNARMKLFSSMSAPTSFGKSLIVDAVLAPGRVTNAAIVVPTIALIDETRRRISARFGGKFKIITHPQQARTNSNVYVMTQERILDVRDLPPLDIFVIDEFYKLDPKADSARSYLLNQAFYRLRKVSRQFYLLGPNIESIPAPVNEVGCECPA